MSRKNKIKKLQIELDETSMKIIDLGDKVKKRNKDLHHEHHCITQGRIAKTRQFTDTQAMENDRSLRPSDKDQSIRTYSKMDLDIWRNDDVRKWFNSNVPDTESHNILPITAHESPSSTGYMISRT